ncbi:hypothetical protein CEXT_575681 [Caerostris extrusa]|uniref:Uncharacterized protein n=1 Tax=Caerostris extrusa TaxID=172846 RepID=A0AAV4XPL5_CAEEX|nr:hypothetical protein CEXT_575681 [Caerostris extrusa]
MATEMEKTILQFLLFLPMTTQITEASKNSWIYLQFYLKSPALGIKKPPTIFLKKCKTPNSLMPCAISSHMLCCIVIQHLTMNTELQGGKINRSDKRSAALSSVLDWEALPPFGNNCNA